MCSTVSAAAPVHIGGTDHIINQVPCRVASGYRSISDNHIPKLNITTASKSIAVACATGPRETKPSHLSAPPGHFVQPAQRQQYKTYVEPDSVESSPPGSGIDMSAIGSDPISPEASTDFNATRNKDDYGVSVKHIIADSTMVKPVLIKPIDTSARAPEKNSITSSRSDCSIAKRRSEVTFKPDARSIGGLVTGLVNAVGSLIHGKRKPAAPITRRKSDEPGDRTGYNVTRHGGSLSCSYSSGMIADPRQTDSQQIAELADLVAVETKFHKCHICESMYNITYLVTSPDPEGVLQHTCVFHVMWIIHRGFNNDVKMDQVIQCGHCSSPIHQATESFTLVVTRSTVNAPMFVHNKCMRECCDPITRDEYVRTIKVAVSVDKVEPAPNGGKYYFKVYDSLRLGSALKPSVCPEACNAVQSVYDL